MLFQVVKYYNLPAYFLCTSFRCSLNLLHVSQGNEIPRDLQLFLTLLGHSYSSASMVDFKGMLGLRIFGRLYSMYF